MGAPLFGREHVERYRETDGEIGHDWQGTTVLLLTTTARKSRAKRTTPLIYQRHGDGFLVVASNGGGNPPGWFLNLQADPIVALQVKAEHHTARARVATAEEQPKLWRIMTETGTPYDEFQARADRDIPVVVLELSERLHGSRAVASAFSDSDPVTCDHPRGPAAHRRVTEPSIAPAT